MRAALQAESRDPATLRRTVSMDCELTDPGQAGGGSLAGLIDELARAIDAYERLGIDDLIVRLQPSTPVGMGPAGPRHKNSRPLTPDPPGKRPWLGTRAHPPRRGRAAADPCSSLSVTDSLARLTSAMGRLRAV